MAKILLNVEVNKADLKQVEQQLSKALNASSSTSSKSGGGTKSATVNVDNLRKSYANLLTTIQGAEKYYKKGTFSTISANAKKLQADLISLKSTQGNYTTEVQRLQAELERLQREFAETRQQSQNMHGSFMGIVKGFAKFQLSAMVVMKPLQMIRNAWADLNETLVETEDAVVALRRVAGEAANANELYDLAQRYGQTFENVSELATNFARAGYEWNETIKATEAALLALNTAELDATEASDGMIAILQQFGYEASELEKIIDKLNITADNAAVSTDALLKALTRTGSSAKNANLTLEETVGIITALSEATGRSGENIGTALNSLIQFSTKASALDTFAKLGGDVENAVELYRQGGATVLDIWEELSKVISNSQTAESILGEGFTTEEFEALNEELKQSLGESFAQTTEIYDTASTFRKNYFIALLQNLDQVQESLDTMNKAQGYSQKENAQYLDTYTAKVNALEAKWQDIANDEQGLLGIKKDLVDIASGTLDIIQRLGGLKGVISTVVAVASPFLTKWAITFGAKTITSAIGGIKSLFTAITTGAISANAALGAIGVVLGVASTIANINYANQRETLEEQATNISKGSTALSSLQDSLDETVSDYDTLIGKIKTYREILDSETTSTNEKETAQSELLTIQNKLVESNNSYATSLDLINGKLETQVGLLNEAKIEELRSQVQEYIDKNTPTEQAAKDYLGSYQDVIFGESTNIYESGLLYKFLKEQGYNVSEDLVYGSWWDQFTASWGGVFGQDTIHTSMGYSYTPEYLVNTLLPEMLKKVEESNYSEDEKTYLKSQIQSVLNAYGEGSTYDEAIKFLYGNEGSSDFIQSLSLEQRKAFANGQMSNEQFQELWNEFYGIKPSGGSGGGSTEKTNLSDVVDKLEQIRENTEKTKELEEKQLALQEARNQRTVRVFNAETGQWEMQANEKDIAEAEKDLKDTAMDNIIDYLSTDEAQEKLNKGEFTLPDWLAEMIAQPTSGDKFNAFMTAMGIMSGAVNKMPTSSGAVYNNSSSNTTNNNQSYSLNGIPIPANEAGRYFTPEALELLNQMGD